MQTRRMKTTRGLAKFWLTFFIIVLMCLLASACARHASAPLGNEETGPRLVGKFIWYELCTNDLDAVESFYSGLFGWEFEDISIDKKEFKVITQYGRPIANVVALKASETKLEVSQWLSYMSVENVAAASARVQKLGGTVQSSEKIFFDGGRAAVARDVGEASFAMVTTSKGDPADKDVGPKMWMGSELWTADVKQAAQFYKDLVGYEVRLVLVGGAGEYTYLYKDGEPRAGIAKLPLESMSAKWIPYIAVKNLEETMIEAMMLGGTLILKSKDTLSEDAMVILADPSGAFFAIQKI